MKIKGINCLEKNEFDEMIVSSTNAVVRADVVTEPLRFMLGNKPPLFAVSNNDATPVGDIRKKLSQMSSEEKRESLIDYFLDYGMVESIRIDYMDKEIKYIVTNSMGRKLIFKGMPSSEEQKKIWKKYNESRVWTLYHILSKKERIFFTADNLYQGYYIGFLPNHDLGYTFVIKTEIDKENGGFKIADSEMAFLREAVNLGFEDKMVVTGESYVEYDGEEHARWRYAKTDDHWIGLDPRVYEIAPDLFLEHNREVLENKNKAKEYEKNQYKMEGF